MAHLDVHVKQSTQPTAVQPHLDLDVLLEGDVQCLVLLLQLVLWVQRIVCALPEGNIHTGRRAGDTGRVGLGYAAKGALQNHIHCLSQLLVPLQRQGYCSAASGWQAA